MPLDFSTMQWFDCATSASGNPNQPAYPANEHFVGTILYSGGSGYGWNVAPSMVNTTGRAGLDPKVYGSAIGASTTNSLIIDSSNGAFNLAVFINNAVSANQRCGVIIFDGTDIKVNSPFMSRSTSVANNTFRIADDSSGMYVSSGATATTAAVAPTFNGAATVIDGGVTWNLYCKVLHAFDSGASTTIPVTSVYDVTGTQVSEASVATTQAVKSATVTRGGISVCKHPNANQLIRSVGLGLQAQPLQDATLKDEFGTSVATPTLYAQEPSGRPVLSLASPAGAQSFTIDPACNMAPYYTIDSSSYAVPFIVTTGIPIPDALAGTRTLGIIQTDGSSAISGSPHTTTFNVTVVSSGGRVLTTATQDGLIPTPSWMNRKTVLDQIATNGFAGWTGQAFANAGSLPTIASLTDLVNAITALTPDGTSWYLLELGGSSYTGVATAPNKDFGTGGLLIRPAAGSDPDFNASLQFGRIRGLHVDGLKVPGKIASMGGYKMNFLFGDPAGAQSYYNRFKFTNCRFGMMFSAGETEDQIVGDIASTGLITSGSITCGVFAYHAEYAEVSSCTFDGIGDPMYLAGCRTTVVENNLALRIADDFLAYIFWDNVNATKPADAFGNSNFYRSVRNNVVHREIDYSTFSNASSGKHYDTGQFRLVAGTSPWGGLQVRTVGSQCTNGDKVYVVASVVGTSKTAASGGPTGTGTGIVDGEVTWNHVATLPPAVLYDVCSGNRVLSTATTGDLTDRGNRQFYFGNTDNTAYTVYASIFDNKVASATVNMFFPCYAGTYWIQYNTGMMPNVAASGLPGNLTKIYRASSAAKIFSSNNILGQAPITEIGWFASFGDIAPDLSSVAGPQAVMNGPFVADAGNGNRASWPGFTDDPTLSASAVRTAMDTYLRPKTGVTAGSGAGLSAVTSTPRRGGISLSLGIGL